MKKIPNYLVFGSDSPVRGHVSGSGLQDCFGELGFFPSFILLFSANPNLLIDSLTAHKNHAELGLLEQRDELVQTELNLR